MNISKIEEDLQMLHCKLASRENISSTMAGIGKELDISFTQTVVLSLSTMGGAHAPIREAYNLWSNGFQKFVHDAKEIYGSGRKIPGFGSSIVKGEYDTILTEYARDMFGTAPLWMDNIEERTEAVQEITGKRIFPNAAAYTACTALFANKDSTWAERNVIVGRLPFWEYLYRHDGANT